MFLILFDLHFNPIFIHRLLVAAPQNYTALFWHLPWNFSIAYANVSRLFRSFMHRGRVAAVNFHLLFHFYVNFANRVSLANHCCLLPFLPGTWYYRSHQWPPCNPFLSWVGFTFPFPSPTSTSLSLLINWQPRPKDRSLPVRLLNFRHIFNVFNLECENKN